MARPGQLHVELTDEQLQYLVIGLPWHRMGVRGRPVLSGNLSEFLSRFSARTVLDSLFRDTRSQVFLRPVRLPDA